MSRRAGSTQSVADESDAGFTTVSSRGRGSQVRTPRAKILIPSTPKTIQRKQPSRIKKGIVDIAALHEETEDGEITDVAEERDVIAGRRGVGREKSKSANGDIYAIVGDMKRVIQEQKKSMDALTKKVEEQDKIIRNLHNVMVEKGDALQTGLEEIKTLIQSTKSRVEPGPRTWADIAGFSTPEQVALGTAGLVSKEIKEYPKLVIDTAGAGPGSEPGPVRKRVEEHVRAKEGNTVWKTLAVTRDGRKEGRVQIICRSEEELKIVKRAVEETRREGERTLRNQLYPIRVDGVRRMAVLNEEGVVRDEAAKLISEENEVNVALSCHAGGSGVAGGVVRIPIPLGKGSRPWKIKCQFSEVQYSYLSE